VANTGSGSTHAVPSLSCVCAFRFYEIDPPACVGVGLRLGGRGRARWPAVRPSHGPSSRRESGDWRALHCASEILIANAKSVEIGGAPTYLSRHHVMTRAQVNVNQRTTIYENVIIFVMTNVYGLWIRA